MAINGDYESGSACGMTREAAGMACIAGAKITRIMKVTPSLSVDEQEEAKGTTVIAR